MSYPSLEELKKRCDSTYKLVILAVKRAKELAQGAAPLCHTEHKKVTSIALEEIRQGKVFYRPSEAEEAERAQKSRGRSGAKSKAKKEG